MYLTITVSQFFSLFFMVMVAFSMSYTFTIMKIGYDTISFSLLISGILAEIVAALCAYFAYQLALQSIRDAVQWLSLLDACCFIATLLLFIFVLFYGPELWQKYYFKGEAS